MKKAKEPYKLGYCVTCFTQMTRGSVRIEGIWFPAIKCENCNEWRFWRLRKGKQ